MFVLQTWSPKSKTELHAQSAADLMKLVVTTVEEFFQVPIAITEDLVQDLVEGLENLFQDYIKSVAACGKQCEFINRGVLAIHSLIQPLIGYILLETTKS